MERGREGEPHHGHEDDGPGDDGPGGGREGWREGGRVSHIMDTRMMDQAMMVLRQGGRAAEGG